jgi:hypothetical protein
MKANELNKNTKAIESIYDEIEQANSRGENKTFIPHWIPVSDSDKLQLMKDGFKVYAGDWDGIMKNALIIEW